MGNEVKIIAEADYNNLTPNTIMKYYDHPDFAGHEMVSFVYDPEVDLKAIFAVHNTHLGPAVGGTRVWNYASDEDALTDALRLSHGMTLKCAMADLPLGGGKIVIMQSWSQVKDKEKFLKAYAKHLNRLDGLLIIGEDVGFTEEYVDIMSEVSPYVFGRSESNGGVGSPSPRTSFGVLQGIRAALKFQRNKNDLKGIKVALQGLGSVGYPLAEMLIQNGATVIACDPNKFAAERAEKDLGIKIVDLNEIYSQDVDIFSPCALGATVNETTIPQFKATIIAGSANNQLFNDACGISLQKKKILYAPDYVINAGGVLWTAQELVETTPEATMKSIEKIYDRLTQIFERSQKTGELTNIIADKIAWEKIHQHDQRVVA